LRGGGVALRKLSSCILSSRANEALLERDVDHISSLCCQIIHFHIKTDTGTHMNHSTMGSRKATLRDSNRLILGGLLITIAISTMLYLRSGSVVQLHSPEGPIDMHTHTVESDGDKTAQVIQ